MDSSVKEGLSASSDSRASETLWGRRRQERGGERNFYSVHRSRKTGSQRMKALRQTLQRYGTASSSQQRLLTRSDLLWEKSYHSVTLIDLRARRRPEGKSLPFL